MMDYGATTFVMPGLVPGIPIRWAGPWLPYRDGRDKPGHDAEQADIP